MRISVQGENPRAAQTMSPCLVLSTEFQPSPLPNCLKAFELFFEISNPNPPWKTSQFPQSVASVTSSRLKHRGAGTSEEGAQVRIKKKKHPKYLAVQPRETFEFSPSCKTAALGLPRYPFHGSSPF